MSTDNQKYQKMIDASNEIYKNTKDLYIPLSGEFGDMVLSVLRDDVLRRAQNPSHTLTYTDEVVLELMVKNGEFDAI